MIFKGNFHAIKEIMAKSRELGMCTFDQALYELYNKGYIAYEEALRNADSANGLRLQIKLRGDRKEPGEGGASRPVGELSMQIDAEEEDAEPGH
jgi:twitching motility protein PilU